MARPRLKTIPASEATQAPEAEAKPVPLPPLNISGVVVRKKDLIAALRIYLPTAMDIQAFEDGEHFYILFGEQTAGDKQPGTE